MSTLLKIFSITLLFSSATFRVVAEETDYYQFPTGEQEGGGVRGKINSCSPASSYPVALVPQNYKSLTTLPSPTLFFDTSNTEQAVNYDFLLLNQNNEIVQQSLLKTHNKSEIASLNMFDNSNSYALKVNDNYHWYLIENCENAEDPKIVANGLLQRIQLNKNIVKQLSNASLVEQIDIYQAANIWHETLESIAQLKCNAKHLSLNNNQLENLNIGVESFNSSLDAYCQTQ